MDIITILLVSIPVFYIWGLISFIRFLSRGNKRNDLNRQAYLKTVIFDIKKELAENPDKKLITLLNQYEDELKKLPAETVASPLVPTTISTEEKPPETAKFQYRSEASLQNWYKDNSINLLLYIGAFLIVVSATIFVSLPVNSGLSKGMLLSLLTVIFLLCGLWFHNMPRIKNAGTAFTAIGALLIPVSGFGWYNFVFKDLHVPFGLIWLLTSFIGLFVYIVLARYFRSVFYSYVTSFSTLSFALAFFNMQNLPNDFYVLGAIFSSIILLSVSMYFKDANQNTALFSEPFALTANITMPVAIAYALFLTSQTTDFTLQSTASILLGACFYVLSYRLFKKSEYVFAAQILFTLGLIYVGFYLHMSTVNVLYLLMASMSVNLYLVAYFQHRAKEPEANVASVFSILKASVIYCFAAGNDIATIHLLIFAFTAMLIGILLTYLRGNALYLGLTSVFLSIALYVLITDQLHFTQDYVVGLVYTVIATTWYVLATHFRSKKNDLIICVLSCAYFFFLSTLFIADAWRYQLFNALAMTVVAFSAAYRFHKKEMVYAGNGLVAFSILSFLQFMHVHIEFYPLVFAGLAYIFYLISALLINTPKEEFRNSALLGAVLAPVLFGYYSFSYYYTPYYGDTPELQMYHTVELYSLISVYTAFVLYGFDAASRKSKSMGYTASVIGLLAYLWQINFLGITEMQYYTFVIGAYFFVLAYIQRRNPASSLKTLFDFLATFFLMVPTWGQTFGDNGASYALILGLIGVGYLIYSITYQDKLYRYTGILAIVLAVVSQSKWAIIGLAGLFFLGFALYLLIYRKEDHTHNKD